MSSATHSLRADNRQAALLDAAARVFRHKGYSASTMRDIAREAGMLPGSIYYHFPTKEDLLLAVYAEGVRRIGEAVDTAVAARDTPWMRLQAACEAHLDHLLAGSDYASVVIRVQPQDLPSAAADELRRLRDAHEQRFRTLVQALPLPPDTDRTLLRLMLLGALNQAQVWYRPQRTGPAMAPSTIARDFVRMLKHPQEPQP